MQPNSSIFCYVRLLWWHVMGVRQEHLYLQPCLSWKLQREGVEAELDTHTLPCCHISLQHWIYSSYWNTLIVNVAIRMKLGIVLIWTARSCDTFLVLVYHVTLITPALLVFSLLSLPRQCALADNILCTRCCLGVVFSAGISPPWLCLAISEKNVKSE